MHPGVIFGIIFLGGSFLLLRSKEESLEEDAPEGKTKEFAESLETLSDSKKNLELSDKEVQILRNQLRHAVKRREKLRQEVNPKITT